MTANTTDATDGESLPRTCPECGADTYPEPNIKAGTRYEATAGRACTDCSWSRIDPNSGQSMPTTPSSSPFPECCDDPDWHRFAVREEKAPHRETRETISRCVNCGAERD